MCANCRRLQAELGTALGRIAELEERIRGLEAELRRGKRQAGPFSRERKKKNLKRPGRRPGEGRFRHRQPPADSEINETHVVPLECCPECGGALEEISTHEQLQVDLPVVRPYWRRFLFQSGTCRNGTCRSCGRRVTSRHPEQVSVATGAAGVSVGPHTKALAADLHHRLGVPYRKIAELFESAFGLKLTASALAQANTRLADRLAGKAAPFYGEIAAHLAESEAAHADETGWRVAGESSWLWVFTHADATLYVIDPRRSHEVVLDVLSEAFEGVLISDGLATYDHRALAGFRKQKCFAHLLRALSEIEHAKSRGAVRFARAVAAVLRDALTLGHEREDLTPAVFAARRAEIEQHLDALISRDRHFTDPDNARMARRLRRQRPHLFTFLDQPGVEATNNRAERQIRPAVLTRKTGGCNRSPPGARTHEILASVLVTLRQQRRDILGFLEAVLTSSGPLPQLLPAPAT
ncbi:MAG TPA: IS66 family transposase [Longimicrobiales bacterium]